MAEFNRILVTGAAGFIGSGYVRYVVEQHAATQLVAFDALTYAGNPQNLDGLGDRVTFVRGDIADVEAVRAAMEGVDAVVNFAAESHVDRSLQDARPFVRTNVEGVAVLLDEARRARVRRFLQVSTDEVYGDLSGSDRHSLETDVLAPRSPYAATKAAAEHLVRSYGISYGMDVVITRGSNTYGPRQYPEKIIPLFITNALMDMPLPLYGQGTAVRDYLYVDDHCAGIDTVLHLGASGEAYNLGARTEVTGVEVARSLLRHLRKPEGLIQFVADRPGHDYRYSVDPGRAEALGWVRRVAWDEGLAATARWYADNRAWWDAVRGSAGFRGYVQRHYGPRLSQTQAAGE